MSYRDGEFTDDGRYDSGDPAADNAARRAYLDRKRRLAEGWHHSGWIPQGRAMGGTLDGADALDYLERRSRLDYLAAVAALQDIEIEHTARP